MMRKFMVLPVLALAATGCVTSLDAVGDNPVKAPAGLPYQLPRTVVTATTVWTLDTCPTLTIATDAAGKIRSIKNAAGAEARKAADGQLAFTTAGVGTVATPEDAYALVDKAEFKAAPAFTQETIGGEFYSIDYEALTNGTKTGSLKVEYHEGTLLLKAINAKVDGKEAEALKSAFSLAGNVARIGLGIPPAATNNKFLEQNLPKADTKTVSACNETTLKALTEKKKLIDSIRGIEADAATLTARAAVLASQRLGGTPTAPETLAALQSQAFAVQDRLDTAKAALAKINQFLSIEGKVKLPGGNYQTYTYQLKLAPEDRDILALRKRIASDECSGRADCLAIADMQKTFSLTATLVGRDGTRGCEGRTDGMCGEAMESVTEVRNGARGGGSQATELRRRAGLIIRQPVDAVLTLQQDDGKTILEKSVMVAQFGLRRTLPLKNRTAESNTLSATFDKNGMPTMIEYTKPRSGTVEVLNALDEGAQTILALQADRRAADKAQADADIARAKNELEALQRQRDMIKVQSEIETMQRVTPTEIEALRAEIATLELLKQIAELKKAIGAASPPPP